MWIIGLGIIALVIVTAENCWHSFATATGR